MNDPQAIFQDSIKNISGKNESVLASGEYTLSKCDTRDPMAKKMEQEIGEVIAWGKKLVSEAAGNPERVIKNMDLAWQEYRKAVEDFHRAFLISQVVVHNKVVDRGTEILARIISGDVTYTGVINYCALGTATTAGAAGDTQLVTETYRKAKSSGTFASNQAYISTFFTATEVTGTFGEVGHFVDGTGSANSGRLFSRIGDPDTTELPVTKTNTETLTIDYKATFAAA